MRFEDGSLAIEDIKLEMLTFTPLCVHENVESCLFIGKTPPNGATDLVDSVTFVQNLTADSNFEGKQFDFNCVI